MYVFYADCHIALTIWRRVRYDESENNRETALPNEALGNMKM